MGKVTGFMEYPRLEEAHEAPAERKKHFREFYMRLPDDQVRALDFAVKTLREARPIVDFHEDGKVALVERSEQPVPPGMLGAEIAGVAQHEIKVAAGMRAAADPAAVGPLDGIRDVRGEQFPDDPQPTRRQIKFRHGPVSPGGWFPANGRRR